MRVSFQNGFYAGLVLAAVIGVYLLQLWQPEKQVRLHSDHLLRALEQKDWTGLADFIDEAYQDQWEQDRALVLTRLREVLRYTRNLRLDARVVLMNMQAREGEWTAQIMVDAEPGELTEFIKQRVNNLETPFRLRWQRKSRKPWDWQLVGVTNETFRIERGFE